MKRLSEERNTSTTGATYIPDETTHGTLMRAWANLAKEIPMVKGRIKGGGNEMKQLHLKCLERAEYHLLAAIAYNDENKKYGVIQGKRQTKNVSITAFNDLIELHGSALSPQKAEEIFHLAKDQHQSVAVVNAESFELLVRAFSDYGGEVSGARGLNSLKKAEELMRLQDLPPRKLTNMYNSIIRGLAMHANKDDVVERVDAILMQMAGTHSNTREGVRIVSCNQGLNSISYF